MSARDWSGAARAYTLVEVLVVVTILGIAGMLVIPSLSQADVLRIQGAVRTIVSDLTYAQADALAYQEQRAVVFNDRENYYTLVEVDEGGVDADTNALWNPMGPDQRYVVSLDDAAFGQSRLTRVAFDDVDYVIFDELGGPVLAPGSDQPGNGGSVDVIGPQARFRIFVAPFTGAVTVSEVAMDDEGEAEDEGDDEEGGTEGGGE